MRKPLVAGNWKMNGSLDSIQALIAGLKSDAASVAVAELVVCPPFVYLQQVCEQLNGSSITCGSQDISSNDSGAFTGEVSGAMLNEFACTYAIVGHSERRALNAESDQLVAEKFVAAQKHGLVPILCIGELLEERESGATEAVVGRQLDAVIDLAGVAAFSNAVIAYEPVWAIGTGKTATPDQAQDVHAFIRGRVARRDAGVADDLRILYGGSVKGSNAAELFAKADIDGGLIGGASLDAAEFITIGQAAG